MNIDVLLRDGRACSREAAGTGRLCAVVGMLLGATALLAPQPASSEEILGTDPASPGHFQVEQRFGYFTTFNPSAPAPRGANLRAVTGETEIGYGVNDWYEVAVTTPYAFARGNAAAMPGAAPLPGYALQTGGVTFRQTFMQPDREERNLFFGLVVRGIYAPPGALIPDLFVPRSSVPILARYSSGLFMSLVLQRHENEITVFPTGAALHDQCGRPKGIVGWHDAITAWIGVKPGIDLGALRVARGVPSTQRFGRNATTARDGPIDEADGIALIIAGRIPDRALVNAGFPADAHLVFARLVNHVVPDLPHVRAAEGKAWQGHCVTSS
jgi:hypothetical protein